MNKKYRYNSHTPGHIAIITKEATTTKVVVKGKECERKGAAMKQQDVVMQKDEVYELPVEHEGVKSLMAQGYLTEEPATVVTSPKALKPNSEK